jgi:hypothetical protein
VREDVFCAFKGFYCLDLRFGLKDLFMHKNHRLHALNIKITTYFKLPNANFLVHTKKNKEKDQNVTSSVYIDIGR